MCMEPVAPERCERLQDRLVVAGDVSGFLDKVAVVVAKASSALVDANGHDMVSLC